MNIVTGASGLVGGWLLLELSKRGKPVRAMKRSDSSVEGVKKLFLEFSDLEHFEKIEWVNADLLDLASLSEAMEGVETLYHTAAFVSFDSRKDKEIYKINIKGTENLVNIAIDKKVSNLIFVSSISALDADEEGNPIDENSKWNPELPHAYYAISKRRAEMEFYRAGEEAGLNIIIANPSVIVGSLNAKRSSEDLFERAFQNVFFVPTGRVSLVDVRDVAFCLVELAERKLWNQRFILDAGHKRFDEVYDFLKTKGSPGKKVILSNSKLKILKLLSIFSGLLGGRKIDDATYAALTGKTVYSNQKIKETLDFEFTPIEESLSFHFERFQSLRNQNK